MSHAFQTMPASTEGQFRFVKIPAHRAAKATFLVLQGRGEYLEKYLPVMEEWAAQDFDVVMPEWRGQGLSSRFLPDPQKAWVPDFGVWLNDLDLFFAQQMKDAKLPVIIVAHSMGAHLALRWYHERNKGRYNVKGLALLSLMQDINTSPFPLGAATKIAEAANRYYSKDYTLLQKGFDPTKIAYGFNLLTCDRQRYTDMMQELRANPALKPGGVTWGWLHAALQSTARLERDLKEKPPTGNFLVLGAASDKIVMADGIRRIAALLPGCETQFYTPARHELLQEAEPVRSDVLGRIGNFANSLI